MFDRELMSQLATIPTENRERWFSEKKKLEALAAEMTRMNIQEMVPKYGIARVIRVLAATIKHAPDEYDSDVVIMASLVPPIRSSRNAEEWFCSSMHRAYVQTFFREYANLMKL